MAGDRSGELLEFLRTLAVADLPEATRERAGHCLIDAVGCGLFGSDMPWSRLLVDEMAEEKPSGSCTVLGHDLQQPAAAAALCNGTAIHGFELDDIIAGTVMHPAAAVVPAALAVAEATGADGAQLLKGLIAGYEAMHRIGLAVGLEPLERGFHTTSLIAPVAAAVAAGIVLELGRDELRAAVGLSCSAASGIKSFADGRGGGMVKRLHLGRAAEAGVRLAQLAGRGFSGPPQALESRFGLLRVYGGERSDPARLTDGLGESWAVDQVWFKVFPICGWIQGVAQLVTELRGPVPLDADAVAAIEVGVSAYAARNNGEPAPEDVMGAQYSIPYCAAAAACGDLRDPGMFDDRKLSDPKIRSLARRVEVHVDPEAEAAYPERSAARVTLTLATGETSERMVLDCEGTPANPCSPDQHLEKFRILSKRHVSPEGADRFLRLAQNLMSLDSARALTAALSPSYEDARPARQAS